MARDIIVHYREGNIDPLVVTPLGNEASVREWWSDPAEVIGLPLIASIYERGFREGIEWSGDQLHTLIRELDVLELYWSRLSLRPEVDLNERMREFKSAIQVAQRHAAILSII